MLLLHKPWSEKRPLNNDRRIQTDLRNSTVPTCVWTEYLRAVRYAHERRIEVVAKQGDLQDQDEGDQHFNWIYSNHYSDEMRTAMISNQIVDIGIEHNWFERFHGGDREIKSEGEDTPHGSESSVPTRTRR
jgi:hypothetical protein